MNGVNHWHCFLIVLLVIGANHLCHLSLLNREEIERLIENMGLNGMYIGYLQQTVCQFVRKTVITQMSLTAI